LYALHNVTIWLYNLALSRAGGLVSPLPNSKAAFSPLGSGAGVRPSGGPAAGAAGLGGVMGCASPPVPVLSVGLATSREVCVGFACSEGVCWDVVGCVVGRCK